MHIFNSKYLAIATIVLVATMALPLSYAQLGISESALVKITAKSWKTITVIKVENSKDNIYNAKLIWLTLQNGVIDSYKAQSGWNTDFSQSNPSAIQFSTDANMIKPGESARFGIKSDQSNPIFQWIVMDEEGDELGSGTIDVIKSMQEEAEQSAQDQGPRTSETNNTSTNSTPTNANGSNKPQVPKLPPAIVIQDEEIMAGTYVRLLGEGFMPDTRVTVLLDGKLIATFRTLADGTIKERVKIPDDVIAGAHQIAVSDDTGRAANLPITVQVEREEITFSVSTDKESYKQGALVQITGKGRAGAAVSLRAVDPAGSSIFSSAVPVGNDGTFKAFIPLGSEAVTGEYLISAFQEGRTVTTTFRVLTKAGYELAIVTDKFEYKQGESVIITGQTSPNKDVTIRVTDPNGAEVFATTVKSGTDGKFSASMILPSASPLGKYSASAKTDNQEISLSFSVIKGSITLTVQTDKTEYRDGELVRITGKGKPNDRVSITILTPKEDRIPMSANTKEDGTYSALWLIQATAPPGNYKAIVQQGDSRVEANFTVFS